MPKPFATLVNETEQELQDPDNDTWTATEIGIEVEQATREVSEYDPHITMYTMEFETRTGTASATTSGSLVDTDESQFLATDVDKVIFNTTDRTWAVVITFTSTSALVLSKDIMASGESYEMYNQDCRNTKQLYIGDIVDYVGDDHGVIQVEYPIDSYYPAYRNFKVEGDVLTVGYDGVISDSDQSNPSSRYVEVNVWIQRQHLVSQLTDLLLLVDLSAGYAAGLKTIHVDECPDETIAEGTEFTIASTRGTYQLTAATTFASTEGDIKFWPGLQNAITNDWVVTVVSSTLSQKLERLVVELAAGKAAISKGALLLIPAITAISDVSSAAGQLALSGSKLAQQVRDLASGRTAIGLAPAIIIEANTEIDNMNVGIRAAEASLTTGRPKINAVNLGGPNVASEYTAQAAQQLASSRIRLEKARGFLAQAAAEGPVGMSYIELGAAELAGSAASINQVLGFIEKIAAELTITDRTRAFTYWGRDKVNLALEELKNGLEPRTYRRYSRG